MSWATEIAKIKYAKIWRILLVIPLVIPSYFAGYLFILSYGPKGKLYDFLNYFGSIDRLPDIYGFIGSWLCLTFDFIELVNKSENPPVNTTLKDFLVSFLIKLIILSIKPE